MGRAAKRRRGHKEGRGTERILLLKVNPYGVSAMILSIPKVVKVMSRDLHFLLRGNT